MSNYFTPLKIAISVEKCRGVGSTDEIDPQRHPKIIQVRHRDKARSKASIGQPVLQNY